MHTKDLKVGEQYRIVTRYGEWWAGTYLGPVYGTWTGYGASRTWQPAEGPPARLHASFRDPQGRVHYVRAAKVLGLASRLAAAEARRAEESARELTAVRARAAQWQASVNRLCNATGLKISGHIGNLHLTPPMLDELVRLVEAGKQQGAPST